MNLPQRSNRKILLTTLVGLSLAYGASAQFIVDFTVVEGYSDGLLAGQNGWTVFDGTAGDPNTFTVDTAGSGSLIVDPSVDPGFQSTSYTGPGSALSGNTLTGSMSYSFNFGVGTSAAVSSAPNIPTIQFVNTSQTSERIDFNVRRVSQASFRLNIVNTLNGASASSLSSVFSVADIGLSIDGSNNWLDGQTDALFLAFEAVHQGSNEWLQTITLTNTDTSNIVATFSETTTDADGSFLAPDKQFRIAPLNNQLYTLETSIDSIAVSLVPEPSSFALLSGMLAMGWIMIRRR